MERPAGKAGPASVPPRCPGTQNGGTKNSAHLIFSFPQLLTPSPGEQKSLKGKCKRHAFPCSGSYHVWHSLTLPHRGQSSFHPWLASPAVGFCSLWTLVRLLGAYWLWTIKARASCEGHVSCASHPQPLGGRGDASRAREWAKGSRAEATKRERL